MAIRTIPELGDRRRNVTVVKDADPAHRHADQITHSAEVRTTHRLLGLFARQDELPIELPAPGEPVEFDEEEAQAIQSAWPRGFIDQRDGIVTDMGFTIDGERAASFKRGLIADTLAGVADRRLSRGEREAATSTCIKSLSLWADDFDAWLVLYKGYLLADDRPKAIRSLKEAERAAKRRGVATGSAFWIEKLERAHSEVCRHGRLALV